MADENKDSIGFKWLKKKGVGGKDKKIQFYESFVYDEVEYRLYDCVYMYKEGYPEPYIGKVIKIWEPADKTKKVKVQWFFYAWEILNYLGGTKAQDKEIFLASGDGRGLANVNPLEAIAGKCNVVCISKDCRNAQPSDEELEVADYIFYRTFDVQSCTISDKMDEKVGGLEIQYIFNRNKHEIPTSIPKLTSERKENSGNATGCYKTLQHSSENLHGNGSQQVVRREFSTGVEPASEAGASIGEEGTVNVNISTHAPQKFKRIKTDENEDPSLVNINLKGESVARDVNASLVKRESVAGVKPAAVAANVKTTLNGDSSNDETKMSKPSTNQVKAKERARVAQDANNLNDRPGKKARADDSVKLNQEKELKEKAPAHENGVKAPVIHGKVKEEATSAQDFDSLKDQFGRKAEGEKSIKLPQEKDLKEKLPANINGVKAPTIEVTVKQKVTSAPDSGNLKVQSGKKVRGDHSMLQDKDLKDKVSVPKNGVKAGVTNPTSEAKSIDAHGKNTPQTGKGVESAKDYDGLDGRASKKAKVGDSLKLAEDKKINVHKQSTTNTCSNAKDVKPTDISSEDHEKSRPSLDLIRTNKESKKEQVNDKVRKFPNEKHLKVPAIDSVEKHTETACQEFEITRKPDDDKATWFRERPWEERLQKAYEQGTLVLLQNLDPDYTSEEVEGIIWHAFNESCSAKVVQRTAMSSPFSGQALIILKTRESTERVLKKLDTECLMLSNGRPLVASRGPQPNLSGKQSAFYGHLVIDKIKIQMQREMKDAVSTSHCSQPNTIEYEMAMEWCALQTRSEKWWNNLYKEQRQELQRLAKNLKQK